MEHYTDLFNPSFLNKTKSKAQFPSDYSLAMAYIPLQESLKTYHDDEGFKNGTIYPELNKEFCGKMVKTLWEKSY